MRPLQIDKTASHTILSLTCILIFVIGIVTKVDSKTVAIEDGLISYWSFDKDTVNGNTIEDLWGDQDAEMVGNLQVVKGKFGEGIQLPGGAGARLKITDDINNAILPKKEITLELWVWDEQFIEWGGYIVACQDNGAFEKGWLIGTRWRSFSFALSSDGADDGDGLLTYLSTANSYDVNQWYHVVGTYDGKEMKIYVDGKLENSTDVQSGDINYPDRIFFTIGAYKDDNEDFSHKGIIDEVRIYERALSEKEIDNNLKAEGLAVESTGKLSLTWGNIKKDSIKFRRNQ